MLRLLALIFAAVLGSIPCHAATVLAAASEDITAVSNGTTSISTAAGSFDSSFARSSFGLVTSSTSIPPTNRWETLAFSSASSDFWFSFQYFLPSTSTTNNAQWVGFYDGANIRLGLEGTGNASEFRVFKRDTTPTKTTLATSTSALCGANTLCKLDCHIVYAVSGSVNCYNNGTSVLTYSGDTTTNSATTLNKMYFANLVSASTSRYSEVIVSDSDTRSMRMYTCAPNAAGATQNWTGSASNVNPTSANDANFNYTGTSNDLSQWTPQSASCTISSSGTTSVLDVRSTVRLAKGTSGPSSARHSLHSNSADSDSGSDLTLATSFGNFTYDWGGTNPNNSSAPWSPSDINSGFSFGVKSRP